ncbi:MAG: phenylalanine--tRNA ligase subunit beta [Trueperaceae bacterium]|nr:phenylalanine--tRNA ligase subunit beta [Trueperaceae bacterium]
MRIPRSWLDEFVDDLGSDEALVARLDGLGLAVAGVHELPAAPVGVVVVEVEGVEPIVGSDHLVLARVRDATRSYDVVCGAPNVRATMRTALAPPGTRLDAIDLVVATRSVMGTESEGMLCSPRELGLFDHGGGLLSLGDDAPIGASLRDLWPAERVIELELTPNRADAFSLLGVARDLGASLGRPVRHPLTEDDLDLGDPAVDDGLRIEIADPERCPRFTLRRIDGVRVGPSPIWLQRRLAALSLRPRNNVVDVTNYVTHELGQPSHAYDLEALAGGVMQVRRAVAGEGLVTLADDSLTLDPDDLVIATPAGDGSRALGLAGVIGGRDDSVRADTVSLALEVAHFEPVGIRRTARRHRLHTDAHYRFERGVDPNLPHRVSARAAALIAEVAGGSVHSGVRAFGDDVERPSITYRPDRVAFIMDLDVAHDEQRDSLERLGCVVDVPTGAGAAWRVVPPSWRFDLAIEEDLVEEVSRLHGYEHIGATVPAMSFVPPASDPTHRALRDALVGLGMLETIGYAFTAASELAAARAPEARVRLSEPQGVERSVLRTALLPGLLAAAKANHAVADLALFEIGRVFLEEERERVAFVVRGARLTSSWRPPLAFDFFLAKGLLEHLAERFGADLDVRPGSAPHLHPGVSAEVAWNGRTVGTLGRLHPEVAAAFELGETYVAELDLPLDATVPVLVRVPRQPFAERDLAVVVPASLPYADLRALALEAAGPELVSLEPFDVFAGEQVGADRKSVALRFRFRDSRRALTDDEVDARMKDVIRTLDEGGYTVRT